MVPAPKLGVPYPGLRQNKVVKKLEGFGKVRSSVRLDVVWISSMVSFAARIPGHRRHAMDSWDDRPHKVHKKYFRLFLFNCCISVETSPIQGSGTLHARNIEIQMLASMAWSPEHTSPTSKVCRIGMPLPL